MVRLDPRNQEKKEMSWRIAKNVIQQEWENLCFTVADY